MARGHPDLAAYAGRSLPRGRAARISARGRYHGGGAGAWHAVLEHLWSAPADSRTALMPRAAAWLRRYTDVTEVWRATNPEGWLARAERAAAAQPFARLRGLEAEILLQLRRLAAMLDEAEWRIAICHGDFHPNNLVLDGERLTGIDLGASSRMPVTKDIARFLAHMGRRGMLPSGQRYL